MYQYLNGVSVSLEELINLRFQTNKITLTHKKRVMTTMAGNYPSSFRGRGLDFMETRHYQPGDDIRAMDWRVTARTGNPHIKLFREERERPIFLLVDYGPQMFFGTQLRFKSKVVALAAAWLAWAAADHGDRIGALIFSAKKTYKLLPAGGRRGVLRLLKALVDNYPKEADIQNGQLNLSLAQLRQLIEPGSLVCIISDFRGLDADGEMHLKQLSQYNDVLAVLVYDPLEKTLPSQAGNYNMSNGQQVLTMNSHNSQLSNAYQELFEERYTYLKNLFQKPSQYMLSLATNDNIINTLRSNFRD